MSAASLHERAAVRAWRALGGQRPEAERVDVLKEESSRTGVYRLHLRADGQPSVIAKRAPHDTAVIERTVYEQILPELPLRVLRYHGSVAEPSGDFDWLFLEEATGTRYRTHRESHRRAAARWLATLHTRVGEPRAARLLPARDPEHYRGLLGSQQEALARQVDDSTLGDDERVALHAVVAHCDWLATRWEELVQVCEIVPDTLVHGDFINHNVFVHSDPSGLVFLPFDWEKAGWGTPAEDLSSVDVDTYWAAVRAERPDLELAALRRLVGVGRIFRCLVYLDWAIPRLGQPHRSDAVSDIRLCTGWLDQLLARTAWAA
jgi:hypothetical protein